METEYIKSSLIDPVLYIQEQERKRISEALHNELGQILYSIQLTISRIEISDLSETNKLLTKEISQLVTEGINTTRRVSFELMPTLLQDYGLRPSIEALYEKLSSRIKIHSLIEIKKRYHENFEIAIFRIVQEILNNIYKHSKASVAKVYLYEDGQSIILEVTDNGVGFEYKEGKYKGMGIPFIQSRVKQLNGSCKINSTKDKGTVITIKIVQP